jgi:uncharacterized membrane protein
MNVAYWVVAGLALTLVLERLLFILGLTAYTYYWTERRLRGFPSYDYKNQLFHASLLTDKSRLVPAPTPHALNSFCIYDVGRNPIRLKALVPDGVYWSVTFHGRNQACYFTLNDMEARRLLGSEVQVVLTRSRRQYQPVGNEIIVEAPRSSRVGLILIRAIVMDPSDPQSIDQVRDVQERAYVEEVA